jgi:DNA-directed RNA polymerase specialized sigma24 family protein
LLEATTPTVRSLFVARAVEGMTMEDIAATHGWSLGTAKRRVAKALARVDAALAREPALSAYLGRGGERSRDG